MDNSSSITTSLIGKTTPLVTTARTSVLIGVSLALTSALIDIGFDPAQWTPPPRNGYINPESFDGTASHF
jgi:hypothetical protein